MAGRQGQIIIGLTLDSLNTLVGKLQELSFGEPVPSITMAGKSKLISSLKTPFLRPRTGSDFHQICEIGAHLFCLIILNHALPNANKRLAVVALINFLLINGYELKATEVRVYAIAMAVAWLSKYETIDKPIEEVKNFLLDAVETLRSKSLTLSRTEWKKLEKEFVGFMQAKN